MQATSPAPELVGRPGPGNAPPPAGPDVSPSGLSRRWATAFVSPTVVLVGLFLVFPALWTIYLGLTDYRLTGLAAAHAKLVGGANYRQVISNHQFGSSLLTTLKYVVGSAVIGQAVLGFSLAWLLRTWKSWLRRVIESLVIVAWIIPGSVVAFLWISYLQGNIGPLTQTGTLNLVLGGGTNWLLRHALGSIIVFNIWRGTAFSMLLFSAALQSVPPSFFEASRVAGASGWQQLRDIVLPSIRGYVLTALLLISLWTFNDFTPYLLTGGGPGNATTTMPIYVYDTAFRQGALGFGAAASTVMLVINLAIALMYIRVLRQRA